MRTPKTKHDYLLAFHNHQKSGAPLTECALFDDELLQSFCAAETSFAMSILFMSLATCKGTDQETEKTLIFLEKTALADHFRQAKDQEKFTLLHCLVATNRIYPNPPTTLPTHLFLESFIGRHLACEIKKKRSIWTEAISEVVSLIEGEDKQKKAFLEWVMKNNFYKPGDFQKVGAKGWGWLNHLGMLDKYPSIWGDYEEARKVFEKIDLGWADAVEKRYAIEKSKKELLLHVNSDEKKRTRKLKM